MSARLAADELAVRMAASGDVEARTLKVEDATVSIAGSGSVRKR